MDKRLQHDGQTKMDKDNAPAPLRATKLIAAGILALAAAGAHAGLSRPAYHPAHWEEDFQSLKRGLEQSYANLQWFASPQGGLDLPALNRRTEELLRSARSDEEAQAIIRAFVGRFRDGHLRELPKIATAAADKAGEPAKRDLAALSADQACAAVGVNAAVGDAFSLPFESIDGFTLMSNGWENGFRTGIFVNGEKKIGVLRLPSFREMDYPAVCRSIWTDLKKEKLDITDRSMRGEMPYQWLASLSNAIATLKKGGADILVIDVAGNGGGNDSGDWSTRLFSGRQIKSAPLLMVAAAAGRYADDQIAKLQRSKQVAPKDRADLTRVAEDGIASFEAVKQASLQACDLSWVWKQQRTWHGAACGLVASGFASGSVPALAPVGQELVDYTMYLYWPAISDPYRGTWSGPAYVLTDGRTASSAEMFTAVLKDNGVARTIGSRTRGSGCGNMMAPRIMTLPHSRMRFQAPDCVRIRSDGSDEVAGIEADIPADPLEGESPRARGARVLSLIARDVDAR